MDKDFVNFAYVAKFRQIWSHWMRRLCVTSIKIHFYSTTTTNARAPLENNISQSEGRGLKKNFSGGGDNRMKNEDATDDVETSILQELKRIWSARSWSCKEFFSINLRFACFLSILIGCSKISTNKSALKWV